MCLLVYLTLPADENARDFCRHLVDAGLCAGMNILGSCHSVYVWEGITREAEEWIIIAQVDESCFEKFEQAVLEAHPYRIPCIIGMSIKTGHLPFLKWIANPSFTGEECKSP